jgi:hypothetical protein
VESEGGRGRMKIGNGKRLMVQKNVCADLNEKGRQRGVKGCKKGKKRGGRKRREE